MFKKSLLAFVSAAAMTACGGTENPELLSFSEFTGGNIEGVGEVRVNHSLAPCQEGSTNACYTVSAIGSSESAVLQSGIVGYEHTWGTNSNLAVAVTQIDGVAVYTLDEIISTEKVATDLEFQISLREAEYGEGSFTFKYLGMDIDCDTHNLCSFMSDAIGSPGVTGDVTYSSDYSSIVITNINWGEG